MKQLRYVDYDCPICAATYTRFVYFDTEVHAPVEQEICGAAVVNMFTEEAGPSITCAGVLVPREMSGVGYMKPINKNNSDFNERERARLEKRQDAHWKRQGRDEAIDRERSFLKKMGAVGGVK